MTCACSRRPCAAAHRAAADGGWVRGVGYDEAAAGPLDRAALDRLVPGVPARIQRRSGVLWMLNSQAIEALGAGDAQLNGVERDAYDRPTGRLWQPESYR